MFVQLMIYSLMKHGELQNKQTYIQDYADQIKGERKSHNIPKLTNTIIKQRNKHTSSYGQPINNRYKVSHCKINNYS